MCVALFELNDSTLLFRPIHNLIFEFLKKIFRIITTAMTALVTKVIIKDKINSVQLSALALGSLAVVMVYQKDIFRELKYDLVSLKYSPNSNPTIETKHETQEQEGKNPNNIYGLNVSFTGNITDNENENNSSTSLTEYFTFNNEPGNTTFNVNSKGLAILDIMSYYLSLHPPYLKG